MHLELKFNTKLTIMPKLKYRGQVIRKLGVDPIATLPDGSTAFLPIDQTPIQKHNLNDAGWPANNIQEYMNSESRQIQDLLMKNMEFHGVAPDGLSSLPDSVRCALLPSRRSQTLSEFLSEQERLDGRRAELFPSEVKPDGKDDGKSDDDLIDKV